MSIFHLIDHSCTGRPCQELFIQRSGIIDIQQSCRGFYPRRRLNRIASSLQQCTGERNRSLIFMCESVSAQAWPLKRDAGDVFLCSLLRCLFSVASPSPGSALLIQLMVANSAASSRGIWRLKMSTSKSATSFLYYFCIVVASVLSLYSYLYRLMLVDGSQ